MKFNLICNYADAKPNEKPWSEPYDKPQLTDAEEVQEWAEGTLEVFNMGCRPGERARKLISVEILGESAPPKKVIEVTIDLKQAVENIMSMIGETTGLPRDEDELDEMRDDIEWRLSKAEV